MSDIAGHRDDLEDDAFFSWNAFGYGLLFFAALSLAVVLWLWLKADDTLSRRADRLASITVELRRTELPRPDAVQLASPSAPPVIPSPVPHAASWSSGEGLSEAPAEGLFVNSKYGNLPVVRSSDGLTPFAAYRRPFNPAVLTGARGLVAIVVVDLGLSRENSEAAIKRLPADVSLVLTPYALDSDFWREAARADGHEVWLSLPMESSNVLVDDAGPLTLLTDTSLNVTNDRLLKVLGSATGYAGVIPSRDTVFYNSDLEARELAKSIFERGLGYVDSDPRLHLEPQSVALSMKAPYAHADIWLDDEATGSSIRARLQELERIALERGYAIAFMRPLPVTYDEVSNWIASLDSRGLALSPLSAQTGVLR
ncbi:MAG: divergent polysaccharide deacetylase family protein [Alphaproteobacteria bacterium]|nr:divergent polysaccharide deacetylase family protein [Alphaproteobacteria bacterium]